MESSNECPICTEPYKGKLHKKITCIHCDKSCCIICSKRTILDDVNDAKCLYPDCKKTWSREFLINSMSYTFVDKEYKKHRENILSDKHMSKMEETQIIVVRRLKIKENYEKIRNIDEEIRNLKYNRQLLVNECNDLNYGTNSIKNTIKFYGRCSNDECNGFINSSWECGICKQKVCKTCKEPLTPEEISDSRIHECDTNIVENLKLIKTDCKNCPKCKVSIQRIQGCRMMWCTQCHTAFDWRTGDIIIGNIHNPHFTEWQKTGGVQYDNIQDGNCDNNFYYNISMRIIESTFSNLQEEDKAWFYPLNNILRHIRYYEMPTLNRSVNNENRELDIRIGYLIKTYTEKEFKSKLQQSEKKKNKARDLYMIYDMFTTTCVNYILTIMYEGITLPTNRYIRDLYKYKGIVTKEQINKTWNIIKKLISYTNQSFNGIKKVYRNNVPNICLSLIHI